MATTLPPEKMAVFLAKEMLDDLDQLTQLLIQFHDRWVQYGQQFAHILTTEQKQELDARFCACTEQLAKLADDD